MVVEMKKINYVHDEQYKTHFFTTNFDDKINDFVNEKKMMRNLFFKQVNNKVDKF